MLKGTASEGLDLHSVGLALDFATALGGGSGSIWGAEVGSNYVRLFVPGRSGSACRGVTVGEQSDPAKLKREAQRWHKIVMWMAFRVFFVETYLRSIVYQISRNSGYYLVFIPLAFFLALSAFAVVVGVYGEAGFLWALMSNVSPAFYVSFALLFWLYYVFLSNSMKTVQELNQLDWLGYDNFPRGRGDGRDRRQVRGGRGLLEDPRPRRRRISTRLSKRPARRMKTP